MNSPQKSIRDSLPARSRPRIRESSMLRDQNSAERPDSPSDQVYQEPELVHEVIMALHAGDKSSLGCAYFSTRNSTLYLSEDIPMAGLDVAEQLINHATPTTLLVSGRTPKFLLDFLESKAASELDDQCASFNLRALGSQDFSLGSARERLANLEFDDLEPMRVLISTANDSIPADGEDGASANAREPLNIRLLRCGSYVDLESHASINCAGAILGDLHRRRSVGFLPDGQRAEIVFHVASLKMFSISDYMFISAEAMQALQIVQAELHPNCQTWGVDSSSTSSKESLSVYGLFHKIACTSQGRSSLRQMFLRPTLKASTIMERQHSISQLLRPENFDLVKDAGTILRKLRNVKLAITHLQKGVNLPASGVSLDRSVWATIRGFAAHVLDLLRLADEFPDAKHIPTLSKLVAMIDPAVLMNIGNSINLTIDFESSKMRNAIAIKRGVDRDLDELLHQYAEMHAYADEAVRVCSEHLPQETRNRIQSCTFFPQLGFLLVVQPDPVTGTYLFDVQDRQGRPWERMFTAEESVCYKNQYLRQLDERYGGTWNAIGDREVELIHLLAGDILEHETMLLEISDLCGHFDAILALAVGAQRYGWVAPRITETSTIAIKNGRHPLQELLVDSFVPNDCHITSGSNVSMEKESGSRIPQALLLTGPNHSGKSIYLKQTAIIVYLAHIGSYVPADEALIGLTDKILTRMSTKESVSRNESAFAIDLRQVSQAIRCSTPRSLLLVDEFGKGTNTDDGAGLLAAMLDHFLSPEASGPRLLIATHFHELFGGGYIDGLPGLRLAHMDVKAAPVDGYAQNRYTYLYKFAWGPSCSSFGTQCAALNGVPAEVVSRAESLSQLLSQNEDIRAACGELSTEETTRLQEAEEVARKFLVATFGEGNDARETLKTTLQLNSDMLEGHGRWAEQTGPLDNYSRAKRF